MFEEENNIIDDNEENEITEQPDEKSDIEIVREKYENKKMQKADDIIAIQAVICIVLAIGFFTANLFYPDICHDIYMMLENIVRGKEHLVPYISDYI